jgi:hypothetical protein
MSPTLEEDLRTALRSWTAGVTSPPELPAAVRRGAGRRQRRRRIALVAVPVAVVAVLAAAVLVAPRLTYTPPDVATATSSLTAADRSLLAGPTGGDLADDTGYVQAVQRAWVASHHESLNADRGIFDHMLGVPTVVWAGTTPAGRAAFVVQLADLREHDNVQLTREGVALLWGFVGPGRDGAPTVVADGYPVPGAPSVEGAFVGRDRRVLLVADRGYEQEQVSWQLDYGADGRVGRSWTPVPFRGGVALLTAPAGADPAAARLRYRGGYADIGNTQDDPLGAAASPADRRLQWQGAERRPVWAVGPDPALAWKGTLPDDFGAEQWLAGILDKRQPSLWPDVSMVGSSLWYAVGRTPDGSALVAGEKTFDADPSHVYAALRRDGGTPRVVGAPTHPDQAVPVRLALPDGQGTLLAAKGRTFTWVEGGTGRSARDAVLVPAAASDVRADGQPVPLS